MASPFDLSHQNNNLESKILVSLERISEAFRVLLWKEGKHNALSPIQLQLLIFLHYHSQEKCKVSYLAKEFNMTKATISDSIKLLVSKGLLEKIDDPVDTRSFILELTDEGEKWAQKAANFATAIERPLKSLTTEQKENMLSSLLKIIHDLRKTGVISIQRMCFTCIHYKAEKGHHYCNLLQSDLSPSHIRIDCPEHESI